MASIKSVYNLLNMHLAIPDYQRPYKWQIKNIEDLLVDVSMAIEDYEKYNHNFKYRIGSVIVFKNKSKFEIVDGQQRILSFALLMTYLDSKISKTIFDTKFKNKTTQLNLHRNYQFIEEWFSLKQNQKQLFKNALKNILEVVVIPVLNISEAFQLFDSQNNRGKALDPHDLLKAYHLREMKDCPYEMEHAVTRWEEKNTAKIKELFDSYLFPIWNWSRENKTTTFSAEKIDTYKGITEQYGYTYAKRAYRGSPYFQATEPFAAGKDFFDMVEHYLFLVHDIKDELCKNKQFEKINLILSMKKVAEKAEDFDEIKSGSVGFEYAKKLFFCALFCYYDKFHNFDERAVCKLFLWALSIRVDMENLGFDTINKYAVGEWNHAYSNNIPVFAKINLARKHNEIANLRIEIRKPENANELRMNLYKNLIEFFDEDR